MILSLQARRRSKIALAALLLAATPAQALTTTTSFTVQITIAKSCSFNTANTLNFGGAIGTLTSNIDQSTTISLTCTNTTPYSLGLNAGIGTGATVAARKMENGAASVTYSLYSDSGRTTVWGDTVGTDTVSGTGSGSSQSYTIYGRVPTQTTPAPQTYTDTVTATITY